MDSLRWNSVIRGHHIYKDIWTPFVGEILCVEQEMHNSEDRFAVAIVKTETIVGHVPRELSRIEANGDCKVKFALFCFLQV